MCNEKQKKKKKGYLLFSRAIAAGKKETFFFSLHLWHSVATTWVKKAERRTRRVIRALREESCSPACYRDSPDSFLKSCSPLWQAAAPFLTGKKSGYLCVKTDWMKIFITQRNHLGRNIFIHSIFILISRGNGLSSKGRDICSCRWIKQQRCLTWSVLMYVYIARTQFIEDSSPAGPRWCSSTPRELKMTASSANLDRNLFKLVLCAISQTGVWHKGWKDF